MTQFTFSYSSIDGPRTNVIDLREIDRPESSIEVDDEAKPSTNISVVVPTLNEGENVAALIDRLVAVLGSTAEIIFVDDGTDDLPERAQAHASALLGGHGHRVHVVRRSAPSGGLGGAVVAGARAATGDVVVVCDGDLQHPPETVPAMLDALNSPCDLVVATRYGSGASRAGLASPLRRAVSTWSGRISRWTLGDSVARSTDPMSGFFAFRKAAVDLDRLNPDGFKVLLEFLVKLPELTVAEVPYPFGRRTAGESHAGGREGVRFLRNLFELRRVGRFPGALSLPAAPSDDEIDLYFGPQHRWVPALSFASSALIIFSICLFVFQRHWSGFLLVPAALNALGAIVSLISSSRRRRYSYSEHCSRVLGWHPSNCPSVDIMLPTAGEDLRILRNTYEHVRMVRWPGTLTVNVLDDADRPEVRKLALAYGFDYSVRSDRGHLKKAGNLLAGFNRTSGDLILVLDADFAPRSDILSHLVPYLDDPSIGIVQSPQFFDFHRGMSWVERSAGATQVLFYRWIQPSRDRSNAAICVGTGAIYRREALKRIGGFAQIAHSEDVHTGVRVMRAGYGIRYVPIVLAKGVCPSAFDQFVTQQYRWCTGSMSLLFSKTFHKQRLTAMQRLSYWSGFLYFISTGVNVFALALPPILIGLFDPGVVRPRNYVFVALALVIRSFMVPLITLNRGSVTSLMRIQMTYSFSHGLALFDQIRRRSDGWVATGASTRSVTAVRLGRLTKAWCVLVQISLWVVLVWRAPTYGFLNYCPFLLLTLLNLYLVYPLIAETRGGARR